MANITLVLRYGEHLAQTDIPLDTDLDEVLRRVRLKPGATPYEEAACQVASQVRGKIEDHKLIRQMLVEIFKHLDDE